MPLLQWVQFTEATPRVRLEPRQGNGGLVAHAMLLIPALGRRGRKISEFEASLDYKASHKTTRVTQGNPVLAGRGGVLCLGLAQW